MINAKLIGARLSFPVLFTPDNSMDNTKDPEYSATFLLNKETQADQIAVLKQAVREAAKEKWGDKFPQGLKLCFKDGDKKTTRDGQPYAGYQGHMFFNAHSLYPPKVVNWDRRDLTEKDGIPYAGCYVNAVVALYAWEHKTGGQGVSAFLTAVQFTDHGERFGNAFNVEAAFDILTPPKAPDVLDTEMNSPNSTGELYGTQAAAQIAGKPTTTSVADADDDLPF